MIHFSSHYRKNKFCCRFSYAMRGWERERERWGGWRNSIDEFSIYVIIENLSFLCWCSDCNKEEREKSVAWQLMHKYKFDVAWKLSFSSELFFCYRMSEFGNECFSQGSSEIVELQNCFGEKITSQLKFVTSGEVSRVGNFPPHVWETEVLRNDSPQRSQTPRQLKEKPIIMCC